jgi:hypothetical protein
MKWDEERSEERGQGPSCTRILAPHQNDEIKILSDEKSLVFPGEALSADNLIHHTKAWTWQCCNALSLALTIQGIHDGAPCLADLACHHHRLISGLSDDLITI